MCTPTRSSSLPTGLANMKTQTLTLILLSVAIFGVGYWYFFGSEGNDAPLTTIAEPSSAQVRFEHLASQLPTSFPAAIFDDARFSALIDITQPIQQETIGRADPFAMVPGLASHAKLDRNE